MVTRANGAVTFAISIRRTFGETSPLVALDAIPGTAAMQAVTATVAVVITSESTESVFTHTFLLTRGTEGTRGIRTVVVTETRAAVLRTRD